ncbi:DUF11 domain-containing protein [Aliikangiella coralliicola]|uniref:DUF11 domain-containing protein n=1 Tax=Aliikangiella coralliicola TaxID=2592383 RepID=A0A545U7U5_9GAMM|nr:DUF11 domain-containing protein [Aliikangiella coralliicola]TQV85537.1 hypothetical protein FLL46_20480 [Aliikangiella coralliicola]
MTPLILRPILCLSLGRLFSLFFLLVSMSVIGAPIVITDINPDQSTLDPVDPDGATGGRINGVATTPGNTNIYYAASEFGGLYKTTDFQVNGGQWFRLEAHLPMLTIDVESAPNGAALYASSLYDGRVNSVAGINVSYDGGTTWTNPPTATPASGTCAEAAAISEPSATGIAVDPDNPSAVYIGTNCGLAISNNLGASWTYSNPFAPALARTIWDVVVHHGGIIDVCGQIGSARSIDGGVSWSIGALPVGRCSIAASPHEADVIFATRGAWVYESDDGGTTWTNLGTPDSRRQGRIPFVETNDRGNDNFDLWYGDVRLYRAGCTSNPANGGLRCPMGNLDLSTNPPQPAGWAGPFTRSVGGHDDVGSIAFDPAGNGVNDCPTLFSSDGGVYYNTLSDEATCHDPQWEQPAVTPHALWLWAMDGFNPAGVTNLDLYAGAQDNGSYATIDGGAASPTWVNRNCCDGFDDTAAATTVLYTICCGSNPSTRIHRRGQGMAGGAQLPAASYPQSGLLAGFKFPDNFDRYGPSDYVAITRDCTAGSNGCVGADGGLFITNNITVDPVIWTELGNATEPPSNLLCAVKSSRAPGGQPVFYVQTGNCNGNGNSDQLWRFIGTNPAGIWQRIDTNLASGSIGIFDVDPNDPNRLYASNLLASSPQMVFSNDAGQTWENNVNLDLAMSGNGQFKSRTLGTAARGRYVQPSFVSFDPSDPNMMIAGAVDSGVFVSTDAGASWLLVTDPHTPVQTGRPHIPHPLYAFFDHDPADRTDIYVGTRGKGIMKIGFRPPATGFKYAAKFVCGDQPDINGLDLVRGRYGTTINIHNTTQSETVFQKQLSLSFPPEEQRPGQVLPIAWDWLQGNQSLKTDCDEIRNRFYDGSFPQGYIEGFITIRSTRPLDVVGVYSSGDLTANGELLHSSIDIEQVQERDTRADLRVEKSPQVFTFDINDNLALHLVLYTVNVQNLSTHDAFNVSLADSLALAGSNVVSAMGFFPSPIDLPPGGSVVNTTSGINTATIDLNLGDIAGGATAITRFWAAVITYQTGFPANADLVDTVEVSSPGGDPSPLNNTAVVTTPIIP